MSAVTMPDGTRLELSSAIAVVQQYMAENPAMIPLFDETSSGDHDEITALDLLALNALNAYVGVPPATAMTSMWLHRDAVTPLVGALPSARIEDLLLDERTRLLPKVCAALKSAEQVRYFGGGGTRVAKLLHRLRPGLIPIWDVWVGEWYGGATQSWESFVEQVWNDVTAPENLAALRAIRDATHPPLSLLRVWDILLWTRARASAAA